MGYINNKEKTVHNYLNAKLMIIDKNYQQCCLPIWRGLKMCWCKKIQLQQGTPQIADWLLQINIKVFKYKKYVISR